MPYALPDNITPNDYICIPLLCPNDEQWRSVLFGHLYELGLWFNHERDSNQTAAAVARVWRDLVTTAILSIGNCTLAGIEDVQISADGILQKKVGGNWIIAGDVAAMLTGSISVSGSGEPSLIIAGDNIAITIPKIGEQSGLIIPGGIAAPTTNKFNSLCAATRAVTDYVIKATLDVWRAEQQRDAALLLGFEGGLFVIETLVGLYTLGLGSAWLEGLPFDELLALTTRADQYDYNALLNTLISQDTFDKVHKELYCIMSPLSSHVLTDPVITQWITNIKANATIGNFAGEEIYQVTLKLLSNNNGWDYLRTRYNAYYLNEDSSCVALFNCNDFDWEHTFDFTASDGGWVPKFGHNTYWQNGLGWKAVDYFRNDSQTWWERSVRIEYTHASTTMKFYRLVASDVIIGSGNPGLAMNTAGYDALVDGENIYEKSGLTEITTTDAVVVAVDTQKATQGLLVGQGWLSSMTVRGLGVDPYL